VGDLRQLRLRMQHAQQRNSFGMVDKMTQVYRELLLKLMKC
jgi:hypothetical protein